MIHYSYNQFHLGDNLVHLHFLRKLALLYPEHHFIHFAPDDKNVCTLKQLREAVEDVAGRVEVNELTSEALLTAGRNVWKNADGFWESHPLRNDYSGFYLDWFRKLAAEMGLQSPFYQPSDLLFDYPKIQQPTPLSGPFDFLILNSRPCSGQARGYDRVDYFDPLIERLMGRYKVIVTQKTALPVPCTTDYGLTLSQIGNLSLFCPYIIGVSSGPSWPTFNVWNVASVKLRIIMLDHEQLNLVPGTLQVQRLEQVIATLQERKLL